MDILGESVDGIENGGFSAAHDEIPHEWMAKGLFQSQDINDIPVGGLQKDAELQSLKVALLLRDVCGSPG